MLVLDFDVIVVGGGHAGSEAAHAAAKRGCKTLLLTMYLDTIGVMSCNPSIGGLAKGQMAREVDALGGLMGRAIDNSMIHFRMLNLSKGAAVQAPRAQADKRLYSVLVKKYLEETPNLYIQQGSVIDIQVGADGPSRVKTVEGIEYNTKSLVLTTGTFLKGLTHIGTNMVESGRAGEPSSHLPDCFAALGIETGRLKTGTPARVHADSIDYSVLEVQPSDEPVAFSFRTEKINRPLLDCYIGYTNENTHKYILDNLHLSPMYSGQIKGLGPRYCPSIEDKVKKFADKDRHQIFLEPEGTDTKEVYISGMSTSLPSDVQLNFLRTIKGLENVHVMRFGYAVEYDFIPPHQTSVSLECKAIPGLFFAGQINGTSGYEEAAGQGLVAGINAAQFVYKEEPLILKRHESFIGVMLDDLTSKELDEPYRMFTSRAEYRLLLRHDNADRRLSRYAYKYGLMSEEEYKKVELKADHLQQLEKNFNEKFIDGKSLLQHLKVNTNTIDDVLKIAPKDLIPEGVSPETLKQFDIDTKYAGYLVRQMEEVEKLKRVENKNLPKNVEYASIDVLRLEARQKLAKFMPATLGQASRISGVNPSDISILMVLLERDKLPIK